MRPYGIVSPMFWTGTTGKNLRGKHELQVMAAYLMTGPHSHQTGIYYLPLMYAAHETGLSIEGASKALSSLADEGFCEYDASSEWIWVREMAAWQIGTALAAGDKRCKGVQQYLETLPALPFIQAFIQRYREDFNLSPLKAPSEGLSSNRTEQDQEQEQVQAPPGRLAKKRQTGWPEGFTLTDDLREYATKNLPQVDPSALFEKFRDQALAKSWAYADWSKAFQTYVRNCAPNSGHFAAGQYPKIGGGIKWM